jgi:hypothetical protein
MKALSIRLVSSEEDWMLEDWFDRIGQHNEAIIFVDSDQNEFFDEGNTYCSRK